MFKKSDILPLILAFFSTILLATLGFTWLASNEIGELDRSNLSQNKVAKAAKPDASVAVSSTPDNGKTRQFASPYIVPQGTSVAINGSSKLERINQALRVGFHQQYPGTIISTNADGNDVGLDLLYSRNIDLLALDRPLTEAEEAAGLQAIPLEEAMTEKESDLDIDMSDMYYVYLEPLNPDAELFLGYAFSVKGKQAILKR